MDPLFAGEPLRPYVEHVIGLDLAQGGADWTALSVLERTEPITGELPTYAVIWLERWQSRSTAKIPERVRAIWAQLARLHRMSELDRTGRAPAEDPPIRIVVDQTGVGPFGLDPLREAGFDPIGIVIHGGDAVSHPDHRTYRVPKRDLAGAVHTLLESERLKIANALPDAATLKAELENFRAKITLTGHDRYEAGSGEEWRIGAHDDLVLSVAVAAWFGERHPPPRLDPAIVSAWTDLPRPMRG
jgi:hypothetical protein